MRHEGAKHEASIFILNAMITLHRATTYILFIYIRKPLKLELLWDLKRSPVSYSQPTPAVFESVLRNLRIGMGVGEGT